MNDSQFFVTQHYRDFLSRDPDEAGLRFFTTQIEQCGTDTACREVKRVEVAKAFLFSSQFWEIGYFVYCLYKAAFGNIAGTPVPVRYQQFFPDAQEVGHAVVAEQGDWQAQLEANKQAFALKFVQRQEFVARYLMTLTPAQFVDTLYVNAGVAPLAADRQAAITESGGMANTADISTRARALRRAAEDVELKQRESDRAFVLMGYFGYLRRNPDDAPDADFSGFNSRLAKFNEAGGDAVRMEVVRSFINSDEYRGRFSGQP